MVDFGRALCGDPAQAGAREWLVTNGLGGYACGTVGGWLTRRYHGLLIAALHPPVDRALLVSKLDETVEYAGQGYRLHADQWVGQPPTGAAHLERFHLEGTTPVWTFACADARLEKRVWMAAGANTTYVRYQLRYASQPVRLRIAVLVNDRDHHANSAAHQPAPAVTGEPHGLRLVLPHTGARLTLWSDRAAAQPAGRWIKNYFLSVEAGRGEDPVDANFHAGDFTVTLAPGEAAACVLSSEPAPDLDVDAAYAARQAYEHDLLARSGLSAEPPAIRQLVLAADQFIVRRPVPGDPDGRSVIAGYPWFTDWGRDTMIALPGLTLATGRFDVAAQILRAFARHVDQGQLPNVFPDAAETPHYNTVDATLWYFEALRAYLAATEDGALLRDLYPVMAEIIAWHARGTRYGIGRDPADGLLRAGEPGVQLTWMDVKLDDWVVTPRTGKAVEINALWHNALRCMLIWAERLGAPADAYRRMAADVQAGFARFWNPALGYCCDVLDGPDGADATLRPNQLFAVALPHSPLTPEQQRAVVDVCARRLLTSHGLRTLPPDDPRYHGRYNGDRRTRDTAYHQGTVWAWLIGPFVSAHLNVYGDRARARAFLQPLLLHLEDAGLGTISEVFDADPPHAPHACLAQAWSVAEVLRVWRATAP